MWNDDPRVKSRRLSISQIRDIRTFGHTTSRISIYRLDLFGFKTSWCSKQKTHLISAGAAWSCCYSWPNVSRSLHSWPSPHLNFLSHNKTKSKLSYKLNNSRLLSHKLNKSLLSHKSNKQIKGKLCQKSSKEESHCNLQLSTRPTSFQSCWYCWHCCYHCFCQGSDCNLWIRVNFAEQCSPSMLSAAD